MHFGQAISTCFRKYVVFTGTAGRPEYWWFTLFCFIVSIATSIADAGIAASLNNDFSVINTLWGLAILLPSLAATVRRLRDAGYAWPWILIALIPLAGAIVLIVLLCRPTKQRYFVPRGGYSTAQ